MDEWAVVQYLISNFCRIGDIEDGQPLRRGLQASQDVGRNVVLKDLGVLKHQEIRIERALGGDREVMGESL